MRHIILVLMIVLLPLRGWAGDSMATQMASSQIAIESEASRAHEIKATATFDHKNQVKSDCHEAINDAAGVEAAASQDHCGTCQACQACHTVALLPTALEVSAILASRQMRPTLTAFTSAAAALGQKPPIS